MVFNLSLLNHIYIYSNFLFIKYMNGVHVNKICVQFFSMKKKEIVFLLPDKNVGSMLQQQFVSFILSFVSWKTWHLAFMCLGNVTIEEGFIQKRIKGRRAAWGTEDRIYSIPCYATYSILHQESWKNKMYL